MGFTRPPRYTSNRIAEMVLVSGMMMAAIMAMRPVFSLPYRVLLAVLWSSQLVPSEELCSLLL